MNTYKSAIIELSIPIAANIIKIKRGTEANIPTLEAGELAFTTDTHKLFVGDGTNNHQVGGEDVVSKANTALQNVVEDTTPQLGGDLDMNGHLIGGNSESDLSDAVAKKHTHSNKSLLDTYDQTNANIKDAVNKRHTQNTDQYLDYGGSNQVAASDVKDAVNKRHVQNTDTALGVQTQDLNMGNHKIINVVDPTDAQDAATKHYVDANAGGAAYTEYYNSFQVESSASWVTLDLSSAIGAVSILVFILCKNGNTTTSYSVGVREPGSTLDRRIFIPPNESFLMITKTDVNGRIEAFTDGAIYVHFYVIATLG